MTTDRREYDREWRRRKRAADPAYRERGRLACAARAAALRRARAIEGLVTVRGSGTRMAHRIVYEALVGPIPDGLTLDHGCRVRRCVNPAHVSPVTKAENGRRTALTPEEHMALITVQFDPSYTPQEPTP